MNKKKMFFLGCIVIFSSLILFILGILLSSIEILIFCLLFLVIGTTITTFSNFNENILFVMFLGTFATFLCSRFFLNYFFHYSEDEYGVFGTNFLNEKTIFFMLTVIVVSLFSLCLGYIIALVFEKHYKRILPEIKRRSDIEIVTKYLFYGSLVFRFIYLHDQSSFVTSTSYFDFFLNYNSSLPNVIIKNAELYFIFYAGFLASFPSKKKATIPNMLFLIQAAYSLTIGRRTEFLSSVVLVIVYYCLRSTKHETGKRWISKLEIGTVVVSFPIILIVMNFIASLRTSTEATHLSFKESLFHFFHSQGVTVNLLGYTKELSNQLPINRFYSFGTIIEYFTNNIVIKTLLGTNVYSGQTVERALNGYLYSHRISYMVMPNAYLLGRGYGSTYIAELYVDFGYLGVILGSMILGVILLMTSKSFYSSKWIYRVIAIVIIKNIILLPRYEYTSFITSTFSLINILGIFIIGIVVFILKKLSK